MSDEKNIIPNSVEDLKALVSMLQKQNIELKFNTSKIETERDNYKNKFASLTNDYIELQNKYRAKMGKFFSPTKERISAEQAGQLGLFNETETYATEEIKDELEDAVEEDKQEVKGYIRKKGGKKKLPDNLPVDEVVYELDETEKECKCCGKSRPIIGENRTEELDIIPM